MTETQISLVSPSALRTLDNLKAFFLIIILINYLSLRYSPEKSSPATEVRARASQAMKSELIRPENIPETKTKDEKPKTKKPKTSRNCRWALFIVALILIVFVAAVVYNFEKLPALNKLRRPAVPFASIAPKNHSE